VLGKQACNPNTSGAKTDFHILRATVTPLGFARPAEIRTQTFSLQEKFLLIAVGNLGSMGTQTRTEDFSVES